LDGKAKNRRECDSGGEGQFRVHGLWPQYAKGFPVNCAATARPITPDALKIARATFSNDGLARYQWRKHGMCTGLDPQAYFALVQTAVARVQIPSSVVPTDSALAVKPFAIEQAFMATNKGLRPTSMAVTCQKQLLREVRVCLSKDVRDFVACPEVDRATCRSPEITVPLPQ
jgi:ribonuclease T2